MWKRFAREGTIRLLAKNPAHYASRPFEFDRRHGTDTGGVIPLRDLDVDSDSEELVYQSTPARAFRKSIALAAFKSDGFTFIDYGFGTGAGGTV